MQELLGRLRALDPSASQSLRVIACFDELMAGGVGPRGLLSAAAALAGRPVNLRRGGRTIRVDTRGEELAPRMPPDAPLVGAGDVHVWIDDDDGARADDALILERLVLALRLRDDGATPTRRDLAILFDQNATVEERAAASGRRGLVATRRYRAVAAPLFAAWTVHPVGPEDVHATEYGPVHAAVVDEDAPVRAVPLGIGIAVAPDDLWLSLRTAVIALRLHRAADGDEPSRADDLGALAEVLATLPSPGRADRDGDALEAVMGHTWGAATVDALVRTSSLREAARLAGVHHSTIATRVEQIEAALGFDPVDGLGRTRLGLAFLIWRLRTSRVLELPTPRG